LDSNYYGPISISLVTGKVTHVLLPWRSCGPIRWWEFKGKTKVIQGRRENAHQWD
jgi:inner membrane protease subunit 2